MKSGTITAEEFVKGYSDLYAIVDGENVKVARISHSDSIKIGRGEEVGYSFGTVTDLDTGKKYEVFQANCDLENCACAVTVEEVWN